MPEKTLNMDDSYTHTCYTVRITHYATDIFRNADTTS
jgi:hypothetical protein